MTPIRFTFWLAFSPHGKVRCSKGQPALSRDERAMHVTATLPKELFSTPSLRATLTIPGTVQEPAFQVDVVAAADALKTVLGVDIDLRVNTPEPSGTSP